MKKVGYQAFEDNGQAHVSIQDEAGRDSDLDAKRVVPVGDEYKAIAASQSNSLLGSTGAAGDYLSEILIVPATTSPGAVSIKDGSGGPTITIFVGGTVADIKPFSVPIGKRSTGGAWYVSTGANVSVLAGGKFS